MSIIEIEDMLTLDKGSESLKRQFEQFCDWCWGHSFGDCNWCQKRFNKYYIPIRKRELQEKLGLKNKD